MAAQFTGGHLRKKIVVIAVFVFLLDGVYNYETKGVLLTEGDSVILHTGVELKEQGRIYWYFNVTRIASITGDLNKSCTDVQCENGNVIFRDRLKLDNQTGSLTITDIRPGHAGDYILKIISSSRRPRENVFNIAVNNVSAAERDKLKRKTVNEGDFFTLEHLGMHPAFFFNWYFNDTFITGNTGNENGDEKFGDRLKLDHQTGALTIKNSRSTDSGDYKLEIIISNSNNFTITILKAFSVNVTGSFTVLIAVLSITGFLLLLLVQLGVIYYRHRYSKNVKMNNTEVDLVEVMEGDGDAPNTDDRRRSELDSLEVPLMIDMTDAKRPALQKRSISDKTKHLQENQM